MLQSARTVRHLGSVPPRSGAEKAVKRKRCSSCGRPGHDRRSCGRLLVGPRPFDPWADLEWEEHDEARRIVAENPDGMTLEEVGQVLGVTRERVRQIEAAALEKLREGTGLGEAATLGAVTVALVECQRCGLLFVRRGRLTLCELCLCPPAKKRRRKPQAVKPRDEFPTLTLIFDFSGM